MFERLQLQDGWLLVLLLVHLLLRRRLWQWLIILLLLALLLVLLLVLPFVLLLFVLLLLFALPLLFVLLLVLLFVLLLLVQQRLLWHDRLRGRDRLCGRRSTVVARRRSTGLPLPQQVIGWRPQWRQWLSLGGPLVLLVGHVTLLLQMPLPLCAHLEPASASLLLQVIEDQVAIVNQPPSRRCR